MSPGGYDRLRNPEELAAYLARLESDDRLAWQKPDEVIRLLDVKRGDRVCDVGVGPGYFALRLARAVGPQGQVYAIDAEPRMLEALRQRMREQGLHHVRPILAEEGLPSRPCDLVLLVNTFHHLRDGVGYLRKLAACLKPGGRIANIDFHKRELPVGPPVEHKVAPQEFLEAAGQAGLRLAAEHDVLEYQYFLVLEPAPPRAAKRPGVAPAAAAGAAPGAGRRPGERIRPQAAPRPSKGRSRAASARAKGSRRRVAARGAARGGGKKGRTRR